MNTAAHTKNAASIRHHTVVGDLMTPSPHTIGSDQTLVAAHEVMREHGLRHLPVLRGGALVGVLTERDLFFLETIAGVDVSIDTVTDAMSPDVYSVAPGDLMRDVARTMAERKLGCAVIVDRGAVVGIFTAVDALRHLADALA